MDAAAVRDNLAAVRDRLAAACARAGRPADAVRLVAICKRIDLELVAAAVAAGQVELGENRIQEALPRRDELAALLRARGLDLPVRWHFVGHLQSNKAGKAAGAFALLHGVDGLKLAERLSQRSQAAGVVQPLLLEVNVAGEAQKHGLAPAETAAVAAAVAGLPHLDLRGLMTMGRAGDSEAGLRATFARLRELRDAAAAACGRPLPELSMGMSGDFEAAVAEGATLVRIGTAIFGPRRAP
jgi:pyridoxal phosphate enzyme (YggS family)